MKFPKHILKVLVLSVATAPVLFVAFQNAAPIDPCSGSSLCAEIHKAMVSARSIDEGLTDAQLIDHAASRFGFGLSALNKNINGQDADTYKVRQVARFLADSIEKKESFVSAQLNALIPEFEQTLPKTGFKVNPLTMTMTDLYDVSQRIMEIRKTVPDDQKGEYSRDITQLRNLIQQSSTRMRLLMSVFGTQRNINGQFIETQVNMNGVLEDFWFNHFNIDQRKVMQQATFAAGGYERVIYNQMHTSFSQLLKTVITHPAMITYLDNQSNKFMLDSLSASNQNLGRELIELHTLGAGPGRFYKQDSVEGSALLLTGLNTFYKRTAPTHYGSKFYSQLHVPDWVKVAGKDVQTAPVVMGHRFCLNSPVKGQAGSKPVDCPKAPNASTPEAREQRVQRQLFAYLDFLANHPRTKQNICGKLVTRFMAGRWVDDPNQTDPLKKIEIARREVIERCVNAWGTGGDLAAIYKVIVKSPELWNRHNYRTFLKNPHEAVISAVRLLGIDIRTFRNDQISARNFSAALEKEIRFLGLPYHAWETPTGYNLNGNRWLNGGYLVRWTSGAFNLTNIYEAISGNKKTLPLLKLTPGQGLKGGRDLAYSKVATSTERANFIKDVLGQADIYRENSYVTKNIDKYTTDPSELMSQRIDGKLVDVPFKSSLNLKISNIFFLRK